MMPRRVQPRGVLRPMHAAARLREWWLVLVVPVSPPSPYVFDLRKRTGVKGTARGDSLPLGVPGEFGVRGC